MREHGAPNGDDPNGLKVPTVVAEAVALHVKEHGFRGAETGAFLLASDEAADDISLVVFAGEERIVRGPEVFRVSGRAVGRLLGWADENGMRVRALVHSHKRRAFLSKTDLKHGFAVRGFTTTIVPWYAAPSPNPSDWAWWRYEGGEWRVLDPATVVNRAAGFLVFDEGGIREG